MNPRQALALLLAVAGLATAAASAILVPPQHADAGGDGARGGDGGRLEPWPPNASAVRGNATNASSPHGNATPGDPWDMEALLADGAAPESPLVDVRSNATEVRAIAREVDLDEDDALLAMALANSGATVAVEDVLTYTERRVVARTVDRTVNYEEETVLSALALGLAGDGGALGDAAAPGDVERVVVTVTTVEQRVDLDRDTVLLAIALANGSDGAVDLEEVLNVNRTETRHREVLQDVTIQEEDAFLRLALGGDVSALRQRAGG